jgi:hypothetical protein
MMAQGVKVFSEPKGKTKDYFCRPGGQREDSFNMA